MPATLSTETPAGYIAAQPPERPAALQTLHDAIRATAPGLAPQMMSGIIGYGKFHYRSRTAIPLVKRASRLGGMSAVL